MLQHNPSKSKNSRQRNTEQECLKNKNKEKFEASK